MANQRIDFAWFRDYSERRFLAIELTVRPFSGRNVNATAAFNHGPQL
jgi:hypothetical protein